MRYFSKTKQRLFYFGIIQNFSRAVME